jgi:glutamyl-tRNA reductase
MQLIALGLSYKSAPLALLEKVAFPHAFLSEALKQLLEQTPLLEAAIVSTCHRTEIYGVAANDARGVPESVIRFFSRVHRVPETELRPHMRCYENQEAVVHLFAVAAGLESMVLGEPQVLGQVREAYGEALGCGTTGKILSRLFRTAVRVGKRARTETAICRTPLSISSLAVSLAEQVLGCLEGKRALVVGAGEMSATAAGLLRKRGVDELDVVSRTQERAFHLASTLEGRALAWEDLSAVLRRVDLVISSTAAPHPVLRAETIRAAMSGRHRPLVLIDIAVPRDIEPEAGQIPNVHLFNMEGLQAVVEKNLKERTREIPAVEVILKSEADEFVSWFRTLKAVPTLRALRDRAESIRSRELERAFQKLGSLSERERQIIEQLSCRIVTKLLHQPTVRLKRLADRSDSLEEAARELFGLDGEA